MASNPPKPLTRARAWTCAGINQLGFPGVGTIMAGRKIGYFQSALMLIGFGFTMYYMMSSFMGAFSVLNDPNWDDTALREIIKKGRWFGIAGSAFSAVAWVWALLSSVQFLREAQKQPPTLPKP
jgi:hypothetical protein